jgi:hypothetical protein
MKTYKIFLASTTKLKPERQPIKRMMNFYFINEYDIEFVSLEALYSKVGYTSIKTIK